MRVPHINAGGMGRIISISRIVHMSIVIVDSWYIVEMFNGDVGDVDEEG